MNRQQRMLCILLMRLMNTFNSQKCRNKRQMDRWMHRRARTKHQLCIFRMQQNKGGIQLISRSVRKIVLPMSAIGFLRVWCHW